MREVGTLPRRSSMSASVAGLVRRAGEITVLMWRLDTRSLCQLHHTSASHLLDHRSRELAALDFLGAFHEPCEVVGHGSCADGAVHALDDEVGGFGPAHVAEH